MQRVRVFSIGLLTGLVLLVNACQIRATPTAPTPTEHILPGSPPGEPTSLPPSIPPDRTPTAIQLLPEEATPVSPTGTPFSAFATPHPILGDLRVRRAIAYCIDKAGLIRTAYPWLEDPSFLVMDSFLDRWHWAYAQADPAIPEYPYDPGQGQALLETAGWRLADEATYRTNAAGQELALTLTTTTAEFRKIWTAALAGQLKACGVRLELDHRPAEWLFGAGSGLSRREFELAACSWAYYLGNDPQGASLFRCDRIPSPENGWQGQNFSGWCNPAADAGIRLATTAVEREDRVAGYRAVQAAYQQEVPAIPLFRRLQILASTPALQNFVPDPGEVYTWNAWQWAVSGKDTLVLGEASEPASLARTETAYVAEVVRALVLGLDVARLENGCQPLTLKALPTVENGGTRVQRVEVHPGDAVVDATGRAAALAEGITVLDAGGEEVLYAGGSIEMNQLVTTVEFVDGLAWSDGTPVSQADYELDYRLTCSPELRATEAFQWALPEPFQDCDDIDQVDFLSDTAYRVIWKPGYHSVNYFLPPIQRQPAHQALADGRRLAEVTPQEWVVLDEVNFSPLGIGPYVVQHWEFGQEIRLRANPDYFQGRPATPNLVIRFVEQDRIIPQLIAGNLDVVGWDSLYPDKEGEPLLAAQAAGQARFFVLPGNVYEHITFALFVR